MPERRRPEARLAASLALSSFFTFFLLCCLRLAFLFCLAFPLSDRTWAVAMASHRASGAEALTCYT